MKRIIAMAIAAIIAVMAYTSGKNDCGIDQEVQPDHLLDMREVVGFDVTEDGLMLYTGDGSGYYWSYSEE